MTTFWGIHNDRPEIDPLSDEAVRIGWDELGDLSAIAPTRDAFREAVAAAYPDDPKSVGSSGGTLYRFVHEMQAGDIVVNPNRANRTLRIGRVSGPYEYRVTPEYRHWRPVEWLIPALSRDEFSEAAQNELSAATTLFQIRTSVPELRHVLTDDSEPTADTDFSWVAFYSELADKIAPFRDNRDELLGLIWTAADRSSDRRLFKYLETDHRRDGSFGSITDIDPYTVFSPFNRGITAESRTRIADAYRTTFGVAAPTPTHFPGIPIVNNLNSWFINWEDRRGADEVPSLWDLFQAQLEYADSQTESTRETLVSAFDGAVRVRGNTRQLSMGLYWMRPETFIALDQPNATFLQERFPDLAERLNLRASITGDEFLANTEAVGQWIESPESPFSTIPELSVAAWNHQRQPRNSPALTDGGPAVTDLPSTDETLIADEYLLENIVADGSFMDIQELDSIVDVLRRKKNIILQGPPGTGKTWLARRLGWVLCGERQSDRLTALQFHPSMSYEDFVRGYRPGSDGRLALVDGPLLTIAQRAADDPAQDYVIVIEEINRGNPAQIFGEMLTLLEHDKRNDADALDLAYRRDNEQPVHLPENLYLIGTMNLADRSLAMVDMALRRRFGFVDLTPQFNDEWRTFLVDRGYSDPVVAQIADRIEHLNDVIANDPNLGAQYRVGHSYFTPRERGDMSSNLTERWYQKVIEYAIRPLLEEHWFDQPDVVDDRLEALNAPFVK